VNVQSTVAVLWSTGGQTNYCATRAPCALITVRCGRWRSFRPVSRGNGCASKTSSPYRVRRKSAGYAACPLAGGRPDDPHH